MESSPFPFIAAFALLRRPERPPYTSLPGEPFFPLSSGALHGTTSRRMAQDLVLRNLSPATARNYLLYGRKFAAFFGRSPAKLGEAEVRQFLLHCIEVQRISTLPENTA